MNDDFIDPHPSGVERTEHVPDATARKIFGIEKRRTCVPRYPLPPVTKDFKFQVPGFKFIFKRRLKFPVR